jgi:light-regulated signal transduction histidine kinase (bacteriophytochrome)
MASMKMPPRQKMINMMYLVLTALLAMNVSKEILDSFVTVNTGLENTKATLQEKMNATYKTFSQYNTENAAKYGKRGGLIVIHAAPRGRELCIRVKDEGMGIPREMLERVFDMFTQVDRGRQRSRGGLGIGLTLVRRIVELHGGRVEAEGEPGRGATFFVVLPEASWG